MVEYFVFGQAEVTEFYCQVFINQNVMGFDVAMYNAVLVQVVDHVYHL